MRFKLTFLLLVLNVALVSYIFYFDKIQSTRSLFDDSNRLILSSEFIQDIDRIEFNSTHIDEPWILTKSDGQWLVDSPIQWKANPFAVEQLFFQLRRLSWESRFSVKDVSISGQSLQSYGLETPPIRINLYKDGVVQTLALGAPTEIGNRLYLMSPDGVFVYVVDRTLLDILQRDLETFLDRRVFGQASRGIRGIQIQDRTRTNVRVRLERKDQDWEFVSPIATKADKDRVEAFIQMWQGVEIEDFVDVEGNTDLGTDSIRLTLEGMGHRETLYLEAPVEGENLENCLAKHEDYPTLFTVDSRVLETLRTAQEDLRERRVLRGFSQNWTSLEIQSGPSNVTVQQLESEDWQVLHTTGEGQLETAPAAPEAILALEALLDTMEAEQFVSDAPSEADLNRYGFNDPQRRVLLRIPESPVIELQIGNNADTEETLLYGRTNQSNSVFLIRPHILAALSLNPLHYRDRTVRELPDTALLENVELINRQSGQPILTVDNTNDPQERGVTAMLEGYLRTTRVERYIAKPFSDPLSLDSRDVLEWPYILKAVTAYPNNPTGTTETIQLYISRRIGGVTQYVGDPLTGLVGTLPISMINALDPILTSNPEEPEPLAEPENLEPPVNP